MTVPTCHTCTHRGVVEKRPCYHPDVDEPGFRWRKVRECHVAERPIDRVTPRRQWLRLSYAD